MPKLSKSDQILLEKVVAARAVKDISKAINVSNNNIIIYKQKYNNYVYFFRMIVFFKNGESIIPSSGPISPVSTVRALKALNKSEDSVLLTGIN
jgi:hypothetical protein